MVRASMIGHLVTALAAVGFFGCETRQAATHAGTGGAATGGAETGGAATGGATSGSGGTPGSGGTDAGANPVDTDAPDSPADLVPADAPVDAAAIMTKDEACRASIRVQCERGMVCAGLKQSTCDELAQQCPDYYFVEDSTRTVAGTANCLAALQARTCTDVLMGIFPECVTAGNRPGGSGCAFASQCQSVRCTIAMVKDSCGLCGTTAGAEGDSCAGTSCLSGLFCHPSTKTCASAKTIVHAGPGEPCNLQGTPVIGCTGDLVCALTGNDATSATCQALPGDGKPCLKQTSTAGSSSTVTSVCARGSRCLNDGCVAIDTCRTGGTCGDDSYCTNGGGGAACVPRPTEGQTCSENVTDTAGPCRAPTICATTPQAGTTTTAQVCVVPRASGDSCDDTHVCARPFACLGGRCALHSAATCPASWSPPDAGP